MSILNSKAGDPCIFCKGKGKYQRYGWEWPDGPDGPKGKIVPKGEPVKCSSCDGTGKLKPGLNIHINGKHEHGFLHT